MDINASIIDQQVAGIVERNEEWLPAGDEHRRKSAAFVVLCASKCLNLEMEEAAELLTDGGHDAGVDALHVGDVEDGEFVVTLFQGKYRANLAGDANFPENDVVKSLHTVEVLFDPARTVEMNPKLRPRVEEIRSMVRDTMIPIVRVVLCNNGARWTDAAQQKIDEAGDRNGQTLWRHFNHNDLVGMLRATRPVDDQLRFSGEVLVDDFAYRRVLVGKVAVAEIAALFNRNDDLLLQRNIRRFLGLHVNRVNRQIHATLRDADQRSNFYFFNNGITITCQKFSYNALQRTDQAVRFKHMQVINGGQTCKTIQQALSHPDLFDQYSDTYVMVRVYELDSDDTELTRDITFATNSQNPVDLRDLRSNDEVQKLLESGIEGLGYEYRRQRIGETLKGNAFSSLTAAEAVLAVWRRNPQQAKYRRSEHFGKLYDRIFDGLHPAQAVLAVLIFRLVENERKRPTMKAPPAYLPYASHYAAMLVGEQLLKDANLDLAGVTHQTFERLVHALETEGKAWHRRAFEWIDDALVACYGEREISLQQLAATFRRGDLLEMLKQTAPAAG